MRDLWVCGAIAAALLLAGCGQPASPQTRESLAAGAGVETPKH